MACPKTKDFAAWINLMPGSDPSLIVTGKVETNAGNMQPKLTPTVPQGFNPQILMLDLTIVDTGGVGTQDVAFRDVRFDKPASQGAYTDVQIFHEKDPCVSLQVGEAR